MLFITLVMVPSVTSALSRLMKPARSEGGLSRGRMRNSNSDHKCSIQTLNHFYYINDSMEEGIKKHGPLHKDLAKIRMEQDTEAIDLSSNLWVEENNSIDFDHDRSFSTEFTSTANDAVNSERATEVGREMQIGLDRKSVISITCTMQVKFKIQDFSSLL